jgi:hypothetical protein
LEAHVRDHLFTKFLFIVSLFVFSFPGNAIFGHVSLTDHIKGNCKASHDVTAHNSKNVPQEGMDSHTEMQLKRGLSALRQVNLAQVEQEWFTLKDTLKQYKIHQFDHEIAEIETRLPELLKAVDYLKGAAFAHEREIITHSGINRAIHTLQKNTSFATFLAATQATLFHSCEDQHIEIAKKTGEDPRSSIENCTYLGKLYPEVYVLSSVIQSLGEDVAKPCGM